MVNWAMARARDRRGPGVCEEMLGQEQESPSLHFLDEVGHPKMEKGPKFLSFCMSLDMADKCVLCQ